MLPKHYWLIIKLIIMPNPLKNLLLILFFTLSFSGLSLASEALLNVDHYNVPEGLSQSTVTSVVEDKYGYVWVGTLNGLNRFDGSKFKHFYSENNDYSLPSSFIRSLYIDKSGRLLIGTDKGLVSYNYELEKFINHNNVLKIEKTAIWSINESKNTIIIGTEQDIIEIDKELRTKLNS
ncbi:ligand-binding sensor domain-containing protein, partial [Shewanella algidipiscicola]|uniref:ligand-binding sensor domain-containing protein n=1 Tax=Shewanella algidipiscicola TaxID=614070 RepID=UPI0027E53D2D